MDEHGARRRQLAWLMERVIGEENALVRTHAECAQAQPAGTIAVRLLPVSRMSVPWRAQAFAHFSRHGLRNAGETERAHSRSLVEGPRRSYPVLARSAELARGLDDLRDEAVLDRRVRLANGVELRIEALDHIA